MALKLTITDTAALLPGSPVPYLVLYVKLAGLDFNAFTNTARLPLAYRMFDPETSGPVGDWLALPLPTAAKVAMPRVLMSSCEKSPFQQCYIEAANYLQEICGDSATVEDLLDGHAAPGE